jgi:putative phosphoribosyl transferase
MEANATAAVHLDIPLGTLRLRGLFARPAAARAVIVFAHGSGSGRLSPRNQFVAATLQDAGFATLLFDLLTAEEEWRERETRHLRFDIALLGARLLAVTRWLHARPDTAGLALGYFGASTGAAAALVAAAEAATGMPNDLPPIFAVVSRGGRPDLADGALELVRAPTLLLVGSDDHGVIELNRAALARLHCEKALGLVAGATHLFEEPGTLAQAAHLAAEWFGRHLPAQDAPP